MLPIIQRVVDSKGIHAVVTNGWWEKTVSVVSTSLTINSRTTAPWSRARALASDCASVDKYFDLLEEKIVKNGTYF